MKIPVREFKLVPSNPGGEVRVVPHDDELGKYFTVQVGGEMISSHKTQDLATAAARHVLAERSAHYAAPPPQSNPVVRQGRTLIYSSIIYIVASKAGMPHNCDAECKKAQHIYKHKFKPGSCIWGLPNGNVEVGK